MPPTTGYLLSGSESNRRHPKPSLKAYTNRNPIGNQGRFLFGYYSVEKKNEGKSYPLPRKIFQDFAQCWPSREAFFIFAPREPERKIKIFLSLILFIDCLEEGDIYCALIVLPQLGFGMPISKLSVEATAEIRDALYDKSRWSGKRLALLQSIVPHTLYLQFYKHGMTPEVADGVAQTLQEWSSDMMTLSTKLRLIVSDFRVNQVEPVKKKRGRPRKEPAEEPEYQPPPPPPERPEGQNAPGINALREEIKKKPLLEQMVADARARGVSQIEEEERQPEPPQLTPVPFRLTRPQNAMPLGIRVGHSGKREPLHPAEDSDLH